MKLWNLLHGVPLAGEYPDQDVEITSISYDTRTLEPGALFVALPGAREDGADYIREALEKGAAAVLGETPPEGENWFQTPDAGGPHRHHREPDRPPDHPRPAHHAGEL